jgi:hypothetical protein
MSVALCFQDGSFTLHPHMAGGQKVQTLYLHIAEEIACVFMWQRGETVPWNLFCKLITLIYECLALMTQQYSKGPTS